MTSKTGDLRIVATIVSQKGDVALVDVVASGTGFVMGGNTAVSCIGVARPIDRRIVTLGEDVSGGVRTHVCECRVVAAGIREHVEGVA